MSDKTHTNEILQGCSVRLTFGKTVTYERQLSQSPDWLARDTPLSTKSRSTNW